MTTPFISVIVPTFDRQDSLTACLQALTQQNYPATRFEIIVVDDGSPVPVVAPDHALRNGVRIIVARQSNAGPASARNTGARQATGEILAFTDDDCAPAPEWLRGLAESFAEAPAALVGGRTVNGLHANRYSAASQWIVDEAYAYFFSRGSDLRFFASNNMAVPARLFQDCGGFDSLFRTSEDRDFCDRWIHRGLSLVYAPEAVVYHRHHLTLPSFCRQHFNYGRGAHQFHRARARRRRCPLRPDLRFYAAVCRRSLFTPLTWQSLPMAGVMGLWQAANLAGFVWQSVERTGLRIED